MTQINSRAPVNLGSGIFVPALSHRFRFVINPDRVNSGLITHQTTSVKINMLDKTFAVKCEHPCPHSQEMLDVIESIANGTNVVEIQLLDGDNNVLGNIKCFAKLVSHDFVLDYASTGIATHTLTFSYVKTA